MNILRKLFSGKSRSSQRGFTLIELLIVIAILGVLAAVALLAINPGAIQQKGRDTTRLKDIATLQGILEQYVTDNIDTISAVSAVSTSGDRACDATGWTGLDLCNYANTIPRDPVNRPGEYTLTDGTMTTGDLYYEIQIDDNLRYRICSRLESSSNALKLSGDGAVNNYFEVYSSSDAVDCTF